MPSQESKVNIEFVVPSVSQSMNLHVFVMYVFLVLSDILVALWDVNLRKNNIYFVFLLNDDNTFNYGDTCTFFISFTFKGEVMITPLTPYFLATGEIKKMHVSP